jgi:general secretion pathway protein N
VTGAFRRPGVRLAVLGIVAYLVFLVANVPAAWLGFALERSSRGALALGDPAGTLWKGSGLLALRSGGAFRGIADLEWSCNPLSVLTGRLSVALSGAAPETRLRASVSVGAGSVRFQNVEANAPAAVLEPALPAAAFAKPDGRLRVLADSVEIGGAGVAGAATVEWLEAGMSGLQRLGDYRLQITGKGERAELKLATLRGDLRLTGAGEWRAAQPRIVQLRGTVEAAAERKDLEPLLLLMGIRGSGIPQPFAWTVPI